MRAGAAGALALLVAAAGCSLTSESADEGRDGTGTAIRISPADGASDLPTGLPITVSAAQGTLKSVTVTAGGRPVSGVFSADRTQWRSDRALIPGATYQVHAVASGPNGATVERTSRFTTEKAVKTFGIDTLIPNKDHGSTLGVGMPIIITFDQPISDRVSVERNLIVEASRPVEGAWHWLNEKKVVWRPKEYWPAHTKVRVVARLANVRGGAGVYGKQDYVREFQIGREQISVADTKTHHMTVKRDGKVIKVIPISAGSGDVFRHYTTSGIHVAMSREPVTVMVSPDAAPGQPGYYRTTTYHNVRISDTGEYVHGAPWSVGSQGRANVSHGCVNASPANAKWFMENTLIGDPIIVTGSPRKLEPTNGWSYFQASWEDWLKQSRLRADFAAPLASV